MMKKIGISILNSDLLNINRTLKELKELKIKNIHIDIADTSFVNNISFGPDIVNKILEHDFEYDIHLMVADPIKIIKLLRLKKNMTINIHSEIKNLDETYNYLKDLNLKIGIAFNPESPIKKIANFQINKILIMSVIPGFGSQSMLKECIYKLKEAKFLYPDVEIAIDGGVNLDTIDDVKEADYFVIGSTFFNSNDKLFFLNSIYKKLSSFDQ